jgi:hypothetical protein
MHIKFWLGNQKIKRPLRRQCLDRRILKRILEESLRTWTEFIWLRIKSMGMLLWTKSSPIKCGKLRGWLCDRYLLKDSSSYSKFIGKGITYVSSHLMLSAAVNFALGGHCTSVQLSTSSIFNLKNYKENCRNLYGEMSFEAITTELHIKELPIHHLRQHNYSTTYETVNERFQHVCKIVASTCFFTCGSLQTQITSIHSFLSYFLPSPSDTLTQ